MLVGVVRACSVVGAVLSMLLAALMVAPAQAGGSIALEERVALIGAAPELMEQIAEALASANTPLANVLCTAQRFGRHWTHLGGGRLGPYECAIGARTLTVEGDVAYYGVRGEPLIDGEDDLISKAAYVVETNPRWSWQ